MLDENIELIVPAGYINAVKDFLDTMTVHPNHDQLMLATGVLVGTLQFYEKQIKQYKEAKK